ncbi:MAG: hypothetical protein HZA50_12380 [Planctomycetes bacterium]|nr:hypothetical protein [Planctomycetota bacterium]
MDEAGRLSAWAWAQRRSLLPNHATQNTERKNKQLILVMVILLTSYGHIAHFKLSYAHPPRSCYAIFIDL